MHQDNTSTLIPSPNPNNIFPDHHELLNCPRCDSTNTKFCYYNNYNLSQPRHFCKNCRRYWTKGGTLRNIPIGGGTRKINKRTKRSPSSPPPPPSLTSAELKPEQSVVYGGYPAGPVTLNLTSPDTSPPPPPPQFTLTALTSSELKPERSVVYGGFEIGPVTSPPPLALAPAQSVEYGGYAKRSFNLTSPVTSSPPLAPEQSKLERSVDQYGGYAMGPFGNLLMEGLSFSRSDEEDVLIRNNIPIGDDCFLRLNDVSNNRNDNDEIGGGERGENGWPELSMLAPGSRFR